MVQQLAHLRKVARKKRKEYQRAQSAEERELNLQEYRRAKRAYETELWEEKSRSWAKFVEKCMETDVWGMPYKLVTERVKTHVGLSSLRSSEGIMTRN